MYATARYHGTLMTDRVDTSKAVPAGPISLADIPDAELVERARRQDVQAYSELVQRYQKKIYALVYNMTSSREDAEDMVQDVFIKAYSSLHHFHGNSSFYTWVYRIAVNRTINYIKKRKRRSADSLDDVDKSIERDPAYVELSAKESPFRDLTITELRDKLNRALQTLSEKHRVVVVMHDIEGIPHEEIAKTLGCSEGTVRSRLFYARQALQSQLNEYAP